MAYEDLDAGTLSDGHDHFLRNLQRRFTAVLRKPLVEYIEWGITTIAALFQEFTETRKTQAPNAIVMKQIA